MSDCLTKRGTDAIGVVFDRNHTSAIIFRILIARSIDWRLPGGAAGDNTHQENVYATIWNAKLVPEIVGIGIAIKNFMPGRDNEPLNATDAYVYSGVDVAHEL